MSGVEEKEVPWETRSMQEAFVRPFVHSFIHSHSRPDEACLLCPACAGIGATAGK